MRPGRYVGRQFARGVTLIELCVVIAIVAILASQAVPPMSDMLAEQRVRAAATELVAELTFARAEAIRLHRRVAFAHLGAGTNWKQGYETYVITAMDSSGTITRGATLRSTPAPSAGSMKICPLTSDADAMIIFRGDGSVITATVGAETGLRIVDDRGAGSSAMRSRNVVISPAGRASVEVFGRGAGSTVSCS